MAESEIQKGRYIPSFGIRLLLWFAIYLGLQLPLFGLFPFFYLFPMGLAKRFFPPIDPQGAVSQMAQLCAYGFYLVHLTLSLAIANKWVFWVLMIILLVVVSLNLSTCMKETNGIGQIKG